MQITMDGREIEIITSDRSLVDVADRVKIAITAPCFRDQRERGCCHGCIVDMEGKLMFACATTPKDGMNVIVDRPDLNRIREQRALKYQQDAQAGKTCGCRCSGDCGSK